jgi:hypothetical protein
LLRFAPLPEKGKPVWIGVDSSNLYRPEAKTAADRSVVYLPNLPESDRPISYGWQISTVVLLPEEAGQGSYVLDSQRIPSTSLAMEVAARQINELIPLLLSRGVHPIILADRWYACAPDLARTADLEATLLLRVKRNRVFYRRAPEQTPGQRGASRKDGDRFQCSDPSTQGKPDEQWQGTDEKGQLVEVRCWNHLHLRTARWVEVSLLQVIRHGASGKARDRRESWFVWRGSQQIDLSQVSCHYRHRYSQEHGYRFDKPALLWDRPRLRTPEQTERWTQVVACAHNQLVLARPLAVGAYRPWEKRRERLTLQQVRRGLPTLLCELGTPARRCNLAENRRGEPKGLSQSLPGAILSFGKRARSAKTLLLLESWRVLLIIRCFFLASEPDLQELLACYSSKRQIDVGVTNLAAIASNRAGFVPRLLMVAR